jgi:branched-chain amino acid transport system substrate-binding protein
MNPENNKVSNKIISAVVILLVLSIIGFTVHNKKLDNSPIKIGVILPLTGSLGFIGDSARHGAEMALENYRNTNHKYELVFEDDQYDVSKTVTAANKLISIDKVNDIVSLGSAEANVVKPLANKNKIIHFTTAASDQTIADGKYNFDHWTPPAEESETMVSGFLKRNVKKVAIFTTNNDGMIAIAGELKRQLSDAGISVILDEKINVGDRGFRTQIAKLKMNSPDIIVMQNTPPELEILAKQIKDAGIKTPLTSIEVFDTTTEPQLFKGNWYVTVSDPTELFANSYKAKYGSGPSLATGNVYDIVSLIITATENVKGTLTNEKVATELLKIKNLDGAMGNLSINSRGTVISKASVKTVK